MKTMSVYGLLGKIYNYNVDLPKKILFRDRIYELDDYNHYVYKETNSPFISYIDLFDETSNWELDDFLHEQVGIIENDEIEEKKMPEKIKIEDDGNAITLYGEKENEWTILDNVEVIICNKINEILDYLESKGK